MNCLYLEAVVFAVAVAIVVVVAVAAAVVVVVAAAAVVVVAVVAVVVVVDCSHARCSDSLRFQPFFARMFAFSKDT